MRIFKKEESSQWSIAIILLVVLIFFAFIIGIICNLLPKWKNVEIATSLIGCVPVSLTLAYQVYTFQKESKANRSDRTLALFSRYCDNILRAKDKMCLDIVPICTGRGSEVVDSVLDIISDIKEILKKDYTYDNAVHREELLADLHDAQHNMEKCSAPELIYDIEKDIETAEAELQKDTRFYNLCQQFKITRATWKHLRDLPDEQQEIEAIAIVLHRLRETLYLYQNSIRVIDLFLYNNLKNISMNTYESYILSLFDASDIKFINQWLKLQNVDVTLKILPKVINKYMIS